MSELLTENLDLSDEIETSKTYTDTGKLIVTTKIDDIDAMKAAINKRLTTEQYDCPLYSFEYGLQTYDLLGKDSDYVIPELKRRIEECLLRDDRITSVSDFDFEQTGDCIVLTFTVATIYGPIKAEKEV